MSEPSAAVRALIDVERGACFWPICWQAGSTPTGRVRFLSWDEYMKNQERLEKNRTDGGEMMLSGAVEWPGLPSRSRTRLLRK